MFEVCVQHTFAAAHALRNYHGKCENLHGHNYKVQVSVTGRELDATGMLFDFVELKRVLRGIAERLDHQNLNETAPFDQINPSAENIARYLFDEISDALSPGNGAALEEVRVWETDIQFASYRAPLRSAGQPPLTPSSN